MMMFDTSVTVIGNVLNNPEFRRVTESNVLVATFKLASTARRYDRLTNAWVDGASLRVRVSCWRRLAENVGHCVHAGDPVIVTGRLFSRDWTGEDSIRRISYELEAVTVGHDLSRGLDKFTRRRSLTTSTVEDAESENRIGGVVTEPIHELNNRARGRTYDDELGGYVNHVEEDPYGDEHTPDPYHNEGLSAVPDLSGTTAVGDEYGDDEDLDDAARLAELDDEPDADDEHEDEDDEDPVPGRRKKVPAGV
jgi:single-strand DNA-binding protein